MKVTLVLPWLNEAEQDIVYPEGVRFQQPAEQVSAAGRIDSCSIHLIPAISKSMPCRSQRVSCAALQGPHWFSAAAAERLAADEGAWAWP